MPGVPRELAEHHLHVRPEAKPVKQPLRRFAEERRKAIGEEIARLLAAGFIMEVLHPDWLANPVLVLKKNGSWRMCIDYTSLNKACPKDPFPLPRIDQVIDSTAGCELLSFLDAYSGYHQIPLNPADQIKTSFITPYGAYCYTTMPFGLKNAGATYQRCMQKCLQDQIGRNVHAYVDDVVVKTKEMPTLLDDLRETFTNLRRFRMKLNPAKCTFGVPAGQLLGYLVSQRGIEANPEKISAIEKMELPQCLKDVQKFTGCLASLSRFVSRLGEKALPLYQLLKKSDKFVWSPQADEAFRDLKRVLSTAPILASPASMEPMLLYIAATNRVVSVVLVVERKEAGKEAGKEQSVQRPVYYLSEVLSQSKQNYPHYQKVTYGVYMAAKKLKHYFQEHPIKVVATAPLAEIIGSKDANGRVAKWALELAAHTILYEPRTAIKSQILADFFVDWAEMQYLPPVPDSTHWKLHFDGSKMRNGLGAGIVVTSPKEIGWTTLNPASNSAGGCLGASKKPSIIPSPDSDSIFVPADPGASQPNPGASSPKSGAHQPNPPAPQPNPGASQSNAGASQPNSGASQPNPPAPQPNPATMQSNPEAPKMEALMVSVFEIKCVPSWAQEFLSYLTDGVLPNDRVQARQIERRAKAYTIINHQLYKRSWIEAKPIKKLDGSTAVTFLKEIIVRYGYPHSIITDNGSNFAEGIFKRYCGEMGIRMDLSSVAHPETNGQVEKANGLILAGIRPRLVEPLERSAGCWIEELPSVLWSLRTTPNRSVGFTPFFLVYGAEAVLPTDIEHDAPRIKLYTEAEAKEAREDGVDLVEEVRLMAESRSTVYQQSLRRYHSRKVKSLAFREGDLVLRLIQRTAGQHKLSSPWEGPFIVSKAVGNDSYYLIDAQEAKKNKANKTDEETKRPWNVRSNVDPNNVPLASLVAQEENVDVNFIKNNNFNNNAYRNNSGNNYRPYPSANGNGYGNSYGNSYNNNRSVPSGLEAMLKEFISTQTAFNKSVEEKLDKIDTIASRVDRLASDVNLLKLKVMPNNDIDNKITTTANAIQVRINENIRLMAELRARWDREENEKLAKENNVAKVWTITTTSNANSPHVAAPPTINGKIIGVGNVSTPSAKRTKLPEIAKTAETACDKTAEIFSNLGNNDPIAVAHNDLDFDDCHISEVIKFLQKLAKSPNASAINLAFTKHITNALIKAREEKLKLETSIPRKLEDGWEPIIKMKFNDFECNALCDLGASISVMPKKIYDMLDLPPLKNCYLDVNLADNVKKKPLGRIDNVHITVNNNLVPVDFVVLDIECNASCPIVLGRPFLRTVGAVIDMREGNIKYQFPLKKGMEHFPRKRMKLPFDSIIRTSYDVDASTLDVT
ncbi:hypothetical protein QYE76_010259 [Lolium multiflorum]|uniref:Integrase catalytic domain-containing protein n=1 Tax=Lolium multiflorum TaxID=4521 RepID=A0AAD8TV95_LOLMU|nr:hypothetical protein QYE76_010259 [Lolium multiflorum]